ncbi:MAG: DUF4384 domain-containing protein [Candidatus Zixiibacteriota bacterium]
MKRLISKQVMLIAAMMLLASAAGAEIIVYDRDIDYSEYIKHDRFLNVEVWTDNDEYYSGDDITISFRADQDCFVAIYNIDTRGNVNLIYPADPRDNGWIEGGETYQIPSQYEDYELTVRGPEGIEYLQIVASRQPFNIPDWYNGSDLAADDDPYDFMDYINANYFQSDHNTKRAFDMTSFMVKEWNDYYFRPVHIYHHDHHPYWDWDWGYYGSVYIDYPWGATIYIDGVYWGVAPLFIPRVYYGWHWITVYDPFGYCWEDRISVVRRKSIVLDRNVIVTRPEIKSRFKEVQTKAYLDPAKNGYPDYEKQVVVKKTHTPVMSKSVAGEKYKIAEETRTTSRYTKTVKTNTGTATKDRSSTGTKSSDRYKTTKSTSSDTKSTYGTSKRSGSDQSSGKSSSDSKSSKTYKSRKSTGSSKESKSGSSGKSSSSESSGKSGKSDSGSSKSGGDSSSKSSGSEKSSSKTTSSGSTTTKRGH